MVRVYQPVCLILAFIFSASGPVLSAPPVPQTPEQLQAHYDATMDEANRSIEAIVAVRKKNTMPGPLRTCIRCVG